MTKLLPYNYLRVVSASDKGQVRSLNEDYYTVAMRPPQHEGNVALLVVADGMGGHKSGEVASQLAVHVIEQALYWLIDVPLNELAPMVPIRPIPHVIPLIYPAPTYFERQLQYAIQCANEEIFLQTRNSSDEVSRMGTTVTAALFVEHEVVIGNVGDSRAYLYRNGEITLLTQDHSYVGELIRLGQLDPSESLTHPSRHLITRSLGHEKEIEIDISTHELAINDRLLLCTDGLWEMMGNSAELLHQLGHYPIEIALKNLLQLANQKGGYDNMTLIIAELVATQ